MAEQQYPVWETCQVDGACIGVQLKDADDQRCLNHTTHDTARDGWWAEVRQGGPLDARGLSFTRKQLDQLLDAIPRNKHNRPQLTEPDFRGATFTGDVRFGGATFTGTARFSGATFTGTAWFRGATFTLDAEFGGATFESDAEFDGATFQSDAEFDGATFKSTTRFSGATFTLDAWFRGATFTRDAVFSCVTFTCEAQFVGATFKSTAWFGEAVHTGAAVFDEATFESDTRFSGARFTRDARFGGATFTGDAWFSGATFESTALFSGARFTRDAVFGGATFTGDARFDKATFTGKAQLGPMLVCACISLTGATFLERLDLEVAATQLDCTRSRFAGGGHLRVGGADIDLTEAEIPEPCILEDGADRLRAHEDLWRRIDAAQLLANMSRTVRLGSLRGATVTGLVLGTVDMSHCRFHGAHSLDRVRVPHSAQLHQAPPLAASRRLPAALRPVAARRHRRQVLAEEITWRQAQRVRSRWAHRDWQSLQVAEVSHLAATEARVLEPTDVAELYRTLRAGREARGDEPGAADFYYGEMEMRRKSTSASWAERRILDLYWLLSGYALRASRALVTLAVVLAASTFVLTAGPLDHLTVGEAFWISLESVALRAPHDVEELTDAGRHLTTTLRFFGPVLLALTVLSVRGRVKR